jgi:hypothetical protein
LANVSLSDVRDTINVSASDIPDAKLQKMIKRAEVTLELELGREIDHADCTEAEKEFMAIRPCWRATLCMLLCLMKGLTRIFAF